MRLLKKKLNVLLIGADSMLGHDLLKFLTYKQAKEDSCINIVTPLSHSDIDITQPYCLSGYLTRSRLHPFVKYDYVINCAAITDTTKIETDFDTERLSYEVNAVGPQNLANTCEYYGVKLIHISTDYVFSEYSLSEVARKDLYMPGGTAYLTLSMLSNNKPFPVNKYGMHKLIGENNIVNAMDKKHYAILRTSWLYGNYKHKSFIHKFLKRCYDVYTTDKHVKCTMDESSIPTSTLDLSQMIYNVIKYDLNGILYATGNDNTYEDVNISRYTWANEIINCLVYKRGSTDMPTPTMVSEFEWLNDIIIDGCMQKDLGMSIRYPKFSRYPIIMGSKSIKRLREGLDSDWSYSLGRFLNDTKRDIYNWLKNISKS